ncbi:odorant receptor 49b-like [Monomorium pharaonis]|uniref:odorant receptor 49b-like n=1 Tax=Monomorium pharaonis TaxID=307658 RepID=UPI001746929B|nr:odorant receptor 49b-like [Monomorium pharaonis]
MLIHFNASSCIGFITSVATGSMLFAYLQYACGVFKIASYRIKNAIEIYTQSINLKNKKLVYKSLIYGIHIHRKAIMFSEYLISNFEMSFMFLIAFGVLTLSLNTFRLFQILSSKYNIQELLLISIITFDCFTYMFFANFIGQEIIDHYNLIFITAYEIQWYITPLYIQKFILFLLLRGNKSFGLNVGGLFVSSLQCFATLANASLSYFVLMYSVGN